MTDLQLMKRAAELASLAAAEGEVPVGAVIARDGEIVSEGRNRRENEKNAVLHAEIAAIEAACRTLGTWRLCDCEMFVTLEPCPMCAGAIINSRLKRVVFGAYDESMGACGSVTDLFSLPFGHRPELIGGYAENECAALMKAFFREKRKTQ